MENNKFKYVFEDDYNFYYTNNISYEYTEYDKNSSEPTIGNIYITNIRKIKSLLLDFGYTVKFVTCEDDDFYELVTELVITWYN